MPKSLPYNRLLIALCMMVYAMHVSAQSSYPANEGDRARYNVQIDIRNAYISGICMMMKEEQIVASIVNEFGVSALSFNYNEKKDKVKIVSAMKQINKWYIKKVLKRDLREIMHRLRDGSHETYENTRFNIKYTFTPLQDDTKE